VGIRYAKGAINISPTDNSATFPAVNLAWRVPGFPCAPPPSLLNLSLVYVSPGVYQVHAATAVGVTLDSGSTWTMRWYLWPIGSAPPSIPTNLDGVIVTPAAGALSGVPIPTTAGMRYAVYLSRYAPGWDADVPYPAATISTLWDS